MIWTSESEAKQAFLDIWRGEIGYHEKISGAYLDQKNASNDGSGNWTKYARDLWIAGFYNGNKQACEWCDMTYDWVMWQLCGKDKALAERVICQAGDCGAGCEFSAQYYASQGRLFALPEVGDQIFFGIRGDEEHTGVIESVNGNLLTTIEGNKGNCVCRCQYDLAKARIAGYGRPWWSMLIGKDVQATVKAEKMTEQKGMIEVKTRMISYGMTGEDVKAMQILLIGRGFSCGSCGADGDYGNGTLSGLKGFQKAHGLDPDGDCGPLTWNAMING